MADLVQKFQAVHCRVIGHKNNRVNRVCIERECKESRLLCDQCGGLHKTHRGSLLTVAEFLHAMVQFESSFDFSANLGRLDQMIEEFADLQQNIMRELGEELQILLDFSNFLRNQFLRKNFDTYEQLDEQMKLILSYVELKNGDIEFNINLKLSDLYPQINIRLAQYQQEINDFWLKNIVFENEKVFKAQKELPADQSNTRTQILQKEINTQSLLQNIESKSIPLQDLLDLFNQESCSEQIKCISPKCVKKISVNNTNDVACLNKSLSLQEKQQFVFRINRLTGYIGIGISIFQYVQANNFIFGPLDQLGHGVFMFLNNGLVYNNTDSKFNKYVGPFQLIEGSKYRLIFDPWNAKGSQFTIQSLSQKPTTFSMPMQIVEGYDYHVFVYMGQQDGEVELLDEI